MLYQHDLATVLDAERVRATIDGEPPATHRTTREWLGVGPLFEGFLNRLHTKD